MEKNEFLVFAEKTGKDEKNNYFYRILTSTDPDIVWGDNFNIMPAGIIPDLEPDPQTISKEYLLTIGLNLNTATESTWFSIQDCIDGIISLIFYVDDENVINVPFGMEFSEAEDIFKEAGGFFKKVKYKPKDVKTDDEES